MKLLFLTRSLDPALQRLVEWVVEGLRAGGDEVDLLDAAPWIPMATDKGSDRETTRELQRRAKGYDLVHAWNWRCAWACGSALRNEPWVYSALTRPKTTHPELLDRLCRARMGFCANSVIHKDLDAAFCTPIRHVPLGVPDLPEISREQARETLGIPLEDPVVMAEPEAEDLDWVRDAVTSCRDRVPAIRLSLGPENRSTRIAAANIVLVADRRSGTSALALEAMARGAVPLVRDSNGLEELIDERVNGYRFIEDHEMADTLAAAFQLPLKLESMAGSARAKAADELSLDRTLERYRKVYLDSLR